MLSDERQSPETSGHRFKESWAKALQQISMPAYTISSTVVFILTMLGFNLSVFPRQPLSYPISIWLLKLWIFASLFGSLGPGIPTRPLSKRQVIRIHIVRAVTFTQAAVLLAVTLFTTDWYPFFHPARLQITVALGIALLADWIWIWSIVQKVRRD